MHHLNPYDIEAFDRYLARKAEEEATYADKIVKEVEFEALTNKSCFNPDQDICRNGECTACSKNQTHING